ncbi:DUF6271 family protein [Streptomyces sp. NBC_00525]|uniref:DUF6271 family protein n=1 Tax=Streptomyces sp. NBC_00525 TaxID=2903660 RepID=UPI002E8103B6|nr:DUF6271 family protein [Streptomyces sp. NBC_00525]WUC94190.1 DUF6271 family protein [Streptomyces sp. NBC_00525]
MRRVCLALPTNRTCPATIAALVREAAYAVDHFDVEVHLLVLDTCSPPQYAEHAEVLRTQPAHPRIVTHHLSEAGQRHFLERVTGCADVAKPRLLLDLMLPEALSYGACTNRAFLVAFALGCSSVHRRDSDSHYQRDPDGREIFPIHHELASLGRRAADAADAVSETVLTEEQAGRRVAMVGGSFVGEPSVDIDEVARIDPEVYYDVVSLWAPMEWPAERKRQLVTESFRGAGTKTFERDNSTLGLVDPMRVDMCNIAFHDVHARVPLPPATDTIGSDYFLIHLVRSAGLPGVLHNRDIVNFHTAERRTDAGFVAYQTRFVKFLLSMLYFNSLYDRLAETGPSLLDERGQVLGPLVAGFARQSMGLDQAENRERLDRVDSAYRRLGGRYAEFADLLLPRRESLLEEAREDIGDFAVLTEAWGELVRAARNTPVDASATRPRRAVR